MTPDGAGDDRGTGPADAAGGRPRVKLCGHTSAADLRASVATGADAVGVIADVSVDTPREVPVEDATDLLATVPPLVTGVLVTMPETVAEAVELVGRTSPDAVQVHGTLAPAEVAELCERVHVDVIAAVPADDPDLAAYAEAADALLVDTPAADGGGGTGRTHDWAATRETTAELDVPVVLAGGLDPDNVAEAVRTVEPFGVDVASGVESEGGVKDRDAVAAFVANATGGAAGSAATGAGEPPATEGSR